MVGTLDKPTAELYEKCLLFFSQEEKTHAQEQPQQATCARLYDCTRMVQGNAHPNDALMTGV